MSKQKSQFHTALIHLSHPFSIYVDVDIWHCVRVSVCVCVRFFSRIHGFLLLCLQMIEVEVVHFILSIIKSLSLPLSGCACSLSDFLIHK